MSVRIERVDGRRGVGRFIDVAWRAQDPERTPWIPPLRLTVKDMLDRKGNPFYDQAERALFIAYRGRRPVGRIAAIENRWHNRYHGDRVGFFGFLECRDDRNASNGLFRAAEAWLVSRGLAASRGPVSPSMNHECGLLVEGFESPPAMMTPWNPPYYAGMVEAAGYQKVQDLLGFPLGGGNELAVPPRLEKLAARVRRGVGVTFRTLDVSTLEQEARRVRELYVSAWEGNWGFVPPSWEEFWHTAKDLEAVLAPELSFVAEAEGEVVGFMLIARNINELLARMPSGRLWPWNVARLLFGLKRIRSGRVVLLGFTPEYRNRGLFPLFAYEAARRGLETGTNAGEASWILDDNRAMIRPLQAMGIEAYKRWRIYEKRIG